MRSFSTLGLLFLGGTLVLFGALAGGGTLVVIVPSNEGLVVAADSRTSVAKTFCDTAFKIVEPTRPARTIVSVTGNGIFYRDPGPGVSDLCAYIKQTPPVLDMERVVKEYVESSNTDIAKLRIEDLAKQCVAALKVFQGSWPLALQSFAGREVFSVVMATYNPKHRTATVRYFVVRIAADTLEPEFTRIGSSEYGDKDPRGEAEFGETAYVDEHVFGGIGRKFLNSDTIAFFLAKKTISQISLQEARVAAVNVIDAASRTTEIIKAPSGIGGPIDVVLLGQNSRPQRLQWKKR